MRNFILSFLFLCIPYWANAQQAEKGPQIPLSGLVEFADANVKAICVKYWDTNYDRELSYAEAAAVTNLNQAFRESEITSFNELQYFTGLTSIGEAAFYACGSLTSIEIPNSVTSIGDLAFYKCSGLTSIVISNSVTSIGYGALYGCSSLTAIVIPNSVTSIGDYAFDGCSALTSIEIPNSVTSIGNYAFVNCTGLTSIKIPNSVTSIGDYAFYACSHLTSIEIPNSVTSIGNSAFYGCSGLTSIEIPNSVTSIGDEAFRACTGLTSIEIPNSVKSIGEAAFYACGSLTNIIVDPYNPVYDSRDNCNAIIETSTNSLIVGCMNTLIPNSVTSIGNYAFGYSNGLTAIEIPNSVTSIGEAAFFGCSGLTSIEIPNSVTSIGNDAFGYSYGLTNIIVDPYNPVYDSRDNCNAIIETSTNTLIVGCKNTLIPNSVTSIGNYAFYYCISLTSIEIPNSVTSIGNYAFGGCWSLTSIEIPNSVTSIGDYIFRGCSSLTDVYCYAETLPSTVSTTFYRSNNYNNDDVTLHVPACAIDDYKSTEPWSGFGNIVPLDPMEFDLTVSDAGVATLYLDYPVAIPEVEGMGDVMYVSDVVGRSLVLTKVENNIPAHTGVIVYAQPGTYTFTSSTTHVDACANSRLSGVTQDTPTADIDGTVYTLSVGKNPEDIGFRKFVGGTLAANKAFLVRNESNEVNFFNFGIDDELTGISKTEQDVDAESAVIYDLQGRRVTSPSKGIYIVNGQKRIINHR